MRIPAWVTLGFAGFVIAFGVYRLYLATRPQPAPQEADARGGATRAGFYRQRPRTQLLIGVLYLLLGGALAATTFGWNPLGSAFGPRTAKPPRAAAPTSTGVPVDRLPAPRSAH